MFRYFRILILFSPVLIPEAVKAQWQAPSSTLSCNISGTTVPSNPCATLTYGYKYIKTFNVSAQCLNCQNGGQSSITTYTVVNVGVTSACEVPISTNFDGGIVTSGSIPYVFSRSQSKVGTGDWGYTQSRTMDCQLNTEYNGPKGQVVAFPC